MRTYFYTILAVISILFFSGEFLCSQNMDSEGVTLYKEKNYSKAQAYFEKALEESDQNAEAQYYLGLIAMDYNRNYSKAIPYLEKAVELDPNKADYHFAFGRALGEKAQNANVLSQTLLAPKIKSAFERAIELKPDHLGGHIGLCRYYLYAPFVVGGSVSKALDQAEEIVRIDAFQGYMMYAAIYDYDKDEPNMIVYFKKAITANPKRYEPYHRLGYISLNKKEIDDAITYFDKMVECAPNDPNSYDSRGDGYMAKNMTDEALKNYQKALSVNPKFAPSMFNVALCYEKKNMKKEALDYYKLFVSSFPNDKKASDAKDKIESLEENN